jgi:pre-mRNA-splicing factor CDC5/CEF1
VDDRLAGYEALLQECREVMAKEAGKAAKVEKKLTITLGGYQARAEALAKRLRTAFDELQKTKIEHTCFTQLSVNESIMGPRRVDAMKEEVEVLARREQMLQERYRELDGERRESEARVAALEQRIEAEAEALNEASLAEMESVDAEQ